MNTQQEALVGEDRRPDSGAHQPGRRLFFVAELVRRNPHLLTEGRARGYIFASEPRPGVKGIIPGNGLALAIVRIGRRVLIDEDKFYEWVNSHRTDELQASANREIAMAMNNTTMVPTRTGDLKEART